jgi:hypothetical protein
MKSVLVIVARLEDLEVVDLYDTKPKVLSTDILELQVGAQLLLL